MREATKGIFERPPRSGVWWISYRDGAGKRHREKIGRRDEAHKACLARRRQVVEGHYVPPQSHARAITFPELARAAMEDREPPRLRPRSYRTDAQRLDILLPLIGSEPAAVLTAEAIRKVLRSVGQRESVHSGSTVNRYRSLLSAIFAFGVSTGRIGSNPVSGAKRLPERKRNIRYLHRDEEEKLREVIRAKYPEREAEMDLALYTGIRRGEQFTLKWKDVDLAIGRLTVYGKTGLRQIVVNSSARAALEKLKARRESGSPYVCPEAKDDAQRDWRTWFDRAVKAAGFAEHFRWHDLRHTFASRLVMAGVDIRTVQELMGHSSIVMTMRYAHLSPDHREAAAEKIGTGR